MSNTVHSRSQPAEGPRESLRIALEHVSHLLPAQGPIGVFIHHNTLHAFQHLPFEEAVCQASGVFGAEPFLREEAYREQMRTGRIRTEDIEAIIDSEDTESILPGRFERRSLRKKLLLASPRRFERSTVAWHLEESDILTRVRPGAETSFAAKLKAENDEASRLRELFSICESLVETNATAAPSPLRARDALLDATGIDLDEIIHPLLIRLCGAFFDQGMAYWPMPNRQEGFLRCVRVLLCARGVVFAEHLHGLGKELRSQSEMGLDAESVVISMLERLGYRESEWESAIQAELLALPGWAGMMHRLEQEPEMAPHLRIPCSLLEFLAVRLTMTAVGGTSVAASNGAEDLAAWRRFPVRAVEHGAEELAQAARLFDAFQILGLTAGEVAALGSILRQRLVDEIVLLDDIERRRILHLAYERRHELDILEPLATFRRSHAPSPTAARPSAQVFFCIDEREESMRRHLEEAAPTVHTYSAAGFFGVAMDYAGIDDAHGVALCPVVIKPQHAAREQAVDEHKHLHTVRQRRRKWLARAIRSTSISSRTMVRGGAATAGLGLLSLVPLAARLLAPRLYGRGRQALLRRFLPQPQTELTLIRDSGQTLITGGKLLLGFTTTEKIDRVAGVLGPAGLREGFARIVVVLGHGSTSLNNPHESAHDCGACGGRRGGPNGRIFAAMANRPEVRAGLADRGIHIPEDTWFVGGYHDTCNDAVDFADVDRIPESHRLDFQCVSRDLNRARAMDALERARRFEAANSEADSSEALRHVQGRAEHLAEPRPEYGHATNAVCIVGRRQITRGLFLDRRSFLISYDATLDAKDAGLAALLGAAMPVCAGISLEYYFSYVDNEGYGCGTKLPHNITGLIGVMNGHASDLRTGLPLQMVEVHEPVRILFVIESTPQRLMRVISANPGLSELVVNRWIRLATIDPDTGEVHIRRDHGFESLAGGTSTLPKASSSVSWFRGKLQHLPIAHITGVAQV